jgi:hypothetical protein
MTSLHAHHADRGSARSASVSVDATPVRARLGLISKQIRETHWCGKVRDACCEQASLLFVKCEFGFGSSHLTPTKAPRAGRPYHRRYGHWAAY